MAKAPGKILWLGGYSVLERPNVSFTTTVDAYVDAKVETRNSNEIILNAPQLNQNARGVVDMKTGKLDIETSKDMHLLKTSVEVALQYVAELGIKPSGLTITTNNDPAFSYSISTGKVVKSGLGSSAAVTVASIAAVLNAFEVDSKENDVLHKLSQTAHSVATGKVGSGFDIASATFGSIFYTRYSPEIINALPSNYTNSQLAELMKKQWDYKIEKFSIPDGFQLLLATFGDSMITTSAVGSVSSFKKKDPDTYDALIRVINEQNVLAINALKKISRGSEDHFDSFKLAFDTGRLLTKKLGELSNVAIEPDDCTFLIEESERHGAYVSKLPGAGGKDAIAALALNDGDSKSLRKFWKNKGLNILEVKPCKRGAQ